MRTFLLLLFAVSFTLVGCADSPREQAIEDTAAPGDQADVIGDGEIIDEAGEPEGNVFLGYDGDADGYLSMEEYTTGIGDTNFAAMDTDGDGRISRAEYDAYMANRGM